MSFHLFLFLSISWIQFLVQQCLLLQISKSSSLMDDVVMVVMVGGQEQDWVPCFSFIFLRPVIFSFLLSSHCHGSREHQSFSIFSPRSNVFLMLLLLTFIHFPSSQCYESLSPPVHVFCQLCGESFLSKGDFVCTSF